VAVTSPPIGPKPLDLGERFADRYRIEEALGRGGMGAVYRAIDELVGETVALKVSAAAPGPDGRAYVTDEQRREVAMARKVTHPNVARVYDLGLAGPSMFLTMELIDGESLSAHRGARPMPLGEIVVVGRQIASALSAAHEVGVLHLDLKPQNVMLSLGRGLRAVLVDFGIAQVLGSTSAGFGTPDYVSPEQLARQPLTGASDVYSLGLVLYELIAGRRAFDGDSAEIRAMARLRSAPRPLGSDTPTELARLIDVMLDPSPSSRPTGLELEQALCAMLDHPEATVPVREGGSRAASSSLASRPSAGPSPSSRDIGLLPDGLGVALAEAHANLSLVGSEAPAVAVADAILARDRTHDVALALRAVALTRHWNLTSFEHRADIAERAAEAVSEALRGASHLAMSHLADALVADYSGDIAYAVRALRRAIAHEPLNAFAHEVLGRLELEGGLGGVDRLRLAFGLDMNRVSAHALIARALYFDGRVREAFEVLDEIDRIRSDANETRTLRCRLALWSRDLDAAAWLLASFPKDSPHIYGAFRRILETLTGARSFDDTFEYIEVLNAVHTTPKRRAFYCQLWAELCGAFERPVGLRYVVHAAQLPLSDLRWLDACPALDMYRAEPAFKYARTLVEDRLTQAFETR